MIPEALFFAVVTCSPTKVDNRIELNENMTKKDVDILVQAKKRCGQIYKDSPCVKRLIIKKDDWGDRMYSIACGQKDHVKNPVMKPLYKRILK